MFVPIYESFINIIYLYRNLTVNNKSVPFSLLAHRSNSFEVYFEKSLLFFWLWSKKFIRWICGAPQICRIAFFYLFISQPPSSFSFKEILSSSSTPFWSSLLAVAVHDSQNFVKTPFLSAQKSSSSLLSLLSLPLSPVAADRQRLVNIWFGIQEKPQYLPLCWSIIGPCWSFIKGSLSSSQVEIRTKATPLVCT